MNDKWTACSLLLVICMSEMMRKSREHVICPVHTNPFSNKNGAVLLRFQKDLRPHLSFSNRFRPSTRQRPIRFETQHMRISIYRPAKLARNWSHMARKSRTSVNCLHRLSNYRMDELCSQPVPSFPFFVSWDRLLRKPWAFVRSVETQNTDWFVA